MEQTRLVAESCGGSYGFVSSHAANSFGLAAVSSGLVRKRWFSWSIFTWAVLVSYSRIYLGVHYPGDVIGGMILGLIIGWIVIFVYKRTIKIFTENKAISGIIALVIGLMALQEGFASGG